MTEVLTLGRSRLRTIQVAILMLAGLVLGFAIWRLFKDVPHLRAGTVPAEPIDQSYVAHPWLMYLHIAPGILYLLGAPIQLAHRIRSRHYALHRRLGRVLVSSALVCGVLALVVGIRFSYGGPVQSAASVVFGIWFLYCLVRAVRAIRGHDMTNHRRWMIRAFAIGLGVGTVRLWVLAFSETGLLSFQDSFAPAFWIAFSLHAAFAEWWIRTTPTPPG